MLKQIKKYFVLWQNSTALQMFEAATKATTEAELRRAEEGRAKCLKTEAEILDRLQLIEQARQQLETFKDTYEKSLRALLDIMEGMHDKAGTRDFFNSIHVY